MKKILFLTLFGLLALTIGRAQTDNAVNEDFTFDPQNKAVVITFDLNPVGSFRLFNIRVEGLLNGQPIKISTLSNTENFKTGIKLQVIWYPERDGHASLQGSLGLNVIAFNPLDRDMDGVGDLEDECPSVYADTPNGCPAGKKRMAGAPCLNLPATAGLGGVAVAGFGLMVAGISKANDARNGELYAFYVEHTNPNDPIFAQNGYQSRQQVFDDANKEYKNGQYLLYGGLAVVATAGAIWLSRKLKCRGEDTRVGDSRAVRLKPVLLTAHTAPPAPGIGVSFSLR